MSEAVSLPVTSNTTISFSQTGNPSIRLIASKKFVSAVIVGATFSMVTIANDGSDETPSSSTARTLMTCWPVVGQDVATSEADPSVETVKSGMRSLRFQFRISWSRSLSESDPCARRITVWSSSRIHVPFPSNGVFTPAIQTSISPTSGAILRTLTLEVTSV